MFWFGAPTQKPVQFKTDLPWGPELHRKFKKARTPKSNTYYETKVVRKVGNKTVTKRKVHGNKKDLKKTQEYPRQYPPHRLPLQCYWLATAR